MIPSGQHGGQTDLNQIIPHSRPSFGKEEFDAVLRVMHSGRLDSFKEVDAFERELSLKTGNPVAAVSSGTAAIHLALQIMGIGEGAAVAIPTHTCPSILYALDYLGARPVLFDCAPMGIGIDKKSFKSAVEQSSAVVIVDTYGIPVPPETYSGIERPVIHDCVHSIGLFHEPVNKQSKNHLSIYSFYPTKMMAGGELGAVSGQSAVIDEVKMLRSPRGADDRRTRYPYSPSDLFAAIAREQLKKLEQFIATRQKIAEIYHASLQQTAIKIPDIELIRTGTAYRFILAVPQSRDQIILQARESGLMLGTGVFTPLHHIIGDDPALYPNSEYAFQHSVSLPIYPTLTSVEQERIINFVLGTVT